MKELYPEGLDDSCRECPALQARIEQWRTLQTLSDHLVAQTLTTSDEELASALPDDLIAHLSEQTGKPLTAAIEADRLVAAQLVKTNNGQTFEAFNQLSAHMEDEIVGQAEACHSRGPLKARIPAASGTVAITLCQLHIEAALDDPQQSLILGESSVQRESETPVRVRGRY